MPRIHHAAKSVGEIVSALNFVEISLTKSYSDYKEVDEIIFDH